MEKEGGRAGSVRAIEMRPGCDRGDGESPEEETEERLMEPGSEEGRCSRP